MAASLSETAGLGAASSLNHDRDVISIVVRFSGKQSYFIDIDVNDTIEDLKDLVAKKSNISSRQINLVLGGQLLSDNLVLKDCNLGACTTIHAFCWCDDGLNSGDVPLKIPLSRGQGAQPVHESLIPGARESDVDLGESFPIDKSAARGEGSDVDVREPVQQNRYAAARGEGSDVDVREPVQQNRYAAARGEGSDVDVREPVQQASVGSDVDVREPVQQASVGSDVDVREPVQQASVGSDVDVREPVQQACVGSDVDGAVGVRVRGMTLDVKACNRTLQQNECHRFFVFCKICGCIRAAKLRLSCIECGNGAFILEQGPSNWEDISSNTTLKGVCTTPSCNCKTPKFYLRCSQSHEGEVEGTSVVLKHVQSNHRRVACIICGDVVSHILIFPCSLGHVICLECFRQYGSTCLSERRFVEHPLHGYTLPCPAGCANSHIEESHHFILLGPEKYEHYKVFGAEEYVLQNGGILCPAPGCGMGLFPEGNDRLIRCQECKFESCRDCQRAYHIGSCEDYFDSVHLSLLNLAIDDERAQRSCWETQSLSLIEETTKPCPGCQTKTERSGGCMHMVCTRCSKEWCWICVKSWNRECQASHWFG